MKILLTALVAAGSVLTADLARADSISLPGSFSTSGIFTCLARELACSGSGTGTLTLGSGSNVATLTFEGVDTEITLTNRATPVVLGRFVVDGPDDFTFPARTNPNPPILRFAFSLAHTTPVVNTNVISMGFGPGGGAVLPFLEGNTSTVFPLPESLPGNYSSFVYSFNLIPFSIAGTGATDLTADVGVVPEPGTIFLVGAGLAGAVARRRRNAAKKAGGDTLHV